MFKSFLLGFLFGSLSAFAQNPPAAVTGNPASGANVSAQSVKQERNTDPRVAEELQKAYAADKRFGPYEAKLLYRQMLRNQNEQKNNPQMLKEMSKVMRYSEEQAKQAAVLYNNDIRPIDYNLPSAGDAAFLEKMEKNPAEAFTKLTVAAPVNRAFLPENLTKEQVEKAAADQAVLSKPEERQPQEKKAETQKLSGPIRSVISLPVSKIETGIKKTAPKKRLGMKTYILNPESFY